MISTVQPGHVEHPGRAHLVNLLDTFVIKGPNGDHRCLVLELMGPNLPDMLFSNPKYDLPWAANELRKYRFPHSMAKEVARQALLGLAYLHGRGINHGG